MNDGGYTLVRIPGSDAIYRLPAGCPVTDKNLRRFGERVTPPAAESEWSPAQHGPDDEYDPDCTCPTCLE